MAQSYKAVYFPDHPGKSARQKNLTLAFGEKDRSVFETIKPLSSHDLRERLGYASYGLLSEAARAENLALNTFCIRLLRKSAAPYSTEPTASLFSGDELAPYLVLDPMLATFRGGEWEPLHRWFPYTEGYSPQFVKEALTRFAPSAARILDPFGGCGTTPLTASQLGLTAYYCELNPVLQYVVEAKRLALRQDRNSRESLVTRLETIKESFAKLLSKSPIDRQLRGAFGRTFGRSVFFTPNTFEKVLQSRTLLDRLARQDPLASHLLGIAVIANLIPVSLLVRRGDLRFKTTEERQQSSANFVDAVTASLDAILSDIQSIDQRNTNFQLVCEDARVLRHLPGLNVDTVLTSPPYLNGTNYFRNTKVELWFLRCLSSQSDLASFRFRAVTAGINDVTNGKLPSRVPENVTKIVKRLEDSQYDPRIPKMVASYFAEMQHIFLSIDRHLAPGGKVILDIGDSAYGNIHVPTDELLLQIISGLSYRLRDQIVLRKRKSRGGFALRQSLLVFEKGNVAHQSVDYRVAARWQPKWNAFKRDLPHQSEPYAKRNWGHPLHSLCSYQGKMKPSLAYHLVSTFVPTGGTMLDVFGGVATIPFEAALQGAKSHSFEISPAALHISRAKLGLLDEKVCNGLLDQLEGFLRKNRVTEEERRQTQLIRFNGLLSTYFSEKTFEEVLLARRFFSLIPIDAASKSLVFSCVLHILHGNRPYALSRRSHPITPFSPTGPSEYRALMPRLRDKVHRSLETSRGEHYIPGSVWEQDATAWWPQAIDQLDAIITSPPFFDSTRFYLANWMRLWFCGWEADDFKTRPLAFVDERQKKGFDIYESIFRQGRERLKPDGVFVLHLGKSRKCDMALVLSALARRWFRVADVATELVDHCESHGIRDKGTVTNHQFLILQ